MLLPRRVINKCHDQDSHIFRFRDPNLNPHFHCYWEGGQPKMHNKTHMFSTKMVVTWLISLICPRSREPSMASPTEWLEFSRVDLLILFGVHELNIDHSYRLEIYPFFRLIALHLDLENDLNKYIPKSRCCCNWITFDSTRTQLLYSLSVHIRWWPFKVRSFSRSHDRSTGHASAVRLLRIGWSA